MGRMGLEVHRSLVVARGSAELIGPQIGPHSLLSLLPAAPQGQPEANEAQNEVFCGE